MILRDMSAFNEWQTRVVAIMVLHSYHHVSIHVGRSCLPSPYFNIGGDMLWRVPKTKIRDEKESYTWANHNFEEKLEMRNLNFEGKLVLRTWTFWKDTCWHKDEMRLFEWKCVRAVPATGTFYKCSGSIILILRQKFTPPALYSRPKAKVASPAI